MSKRKIESRRLARLEREESRLQREIGKAGLFADGVRSDFWRAVEGKLKADLLAIETGLDDYRKLTDHQIRDLLADRMRLRGFIGIKDFVKAKVNFENQLTLVQQKIREEHERLNSR